MIKNLISLFYKANKKSLALNYLLIQLLIWLKSLWYYSLFGFGKVLPHSKNFFPEWAITLDLIFHTLGHIAIGIIAIAYGYKTKNFSIKILPTIILAVVLHNLFYYLTNSHPNILYSITDFGIDSMLLLTFVFIGHLASKITRT